MVFPSLPLYNWSQHANQQTSTGLIITSDPVQAPPPPAGGGGSGDGGGGGAGPMIRPGSMVDRARLAQIPLPEGGLKCPRCESTNTKFCYFNNYSLSQPRHFCKSCRRYWTRGGALRNVPVGGGCRRNKRTKRRGAATSSTTNIVSSSNNISANNLSSQVVVPPQAELHFLPGGLQHLGGYVSDFGLNLDGGVSRVQQFPNLIGGSDATTSGLYPFLEESELDHNSGLGQVTRVKMEGNQGLNLSKNSLLGNQGNDDQLINMWGAGNAWTNLSGFHSPTAGHLL